MFDMLKGTKNYLYIAERLTEVTAAGALSGEGYFKITGKASTNSGLPTDSEIGNVFYNKPPVTLVDGDSVIPFKLTKAGFVTNIPQSSSKQKFECTVQTDNSKTYVEGDKVEISGTISGYYRRNDPYVKKVLSRAFPITVDDGAGNIEYSEVQTGVVDMFLGRDETTEVGKTEIMQYLPSILDNVKLDKPMEGIQPLDFNYTVVGSECPCIYERKITA